MTTKYRIYTEGGVDGKMYFTGDHWYGLGFFNQAQEAYPCDSKEEAEELKKWLDDNIIPESTHIIEEYEDENP